MKNFVIIRTHFGVPQNFIRAETRNRCSEDFVVILREVARVLYPDAEFDIFLSIPEPGSYVDVTKFAQRISGAGAVAAITATTGVGVLALAYLTYKDTQEEHLYEKQMRPVNDAQKCLDLRKKIEELGNEEDIVNVSDEIMRDICSNISIKKRKNDFYETLAGDKMVDSIEISGLLNQDGLTINSGTISSGDFNKYIEPIKDEKIEFESQRGVLELISPVVKQKKEGKGIPWRATYYGDDIVFDKVKILSNGEDMDFFMQDPDFKDQTRNGERTFRHNDNMEVIFTLKGEVKGSLVVNRSIYIKEVVSYNKEIIPHKEIFQREKRARMEQEQKSNLFDGLRIEN